MKKKDLPQDNSKLENVTRELCYTQDESGEYTTGLSKGWEVKAKALDVAWEDIKERTAEARAKVERGEASPILFFMELRLMDLPILAGYTGFWKWTIKRHLKPHNFKKLSTKKLQKYADAFDVSIEDLKHMRFNES
ncbi:hypothetical protein Oweho_0888 [Owenweeksia hongkongensis DSM 17368]|uniref:HTH cro/C1-type domain-containing protein n=1 Tax=Owenweeksia hongkongensis (strain DSM 17368 / CIP 108786 / JCM 12287 / NRRL B-23963 / UST20020801) TaxID=926562 RepID=G8R2U4_OWEHD|nr:hypothetical protein [Owenweeksia hongkongensis]AEV31899.1 hypothetical protein Oweho_0888 [Owenweeksia hongkongensis DSM 17368]